MTDILDTIDNAIADHELSADAMRWTPDPQPATGGHLPASPDIARIARLFDVPSAFLTLIRPSVVLEPWEIAAAARRSQIRRAYRAKRRGW